MAAMLQRVLSVMLAIFAVAIILTWTVVPAGDRGHTRAICEAISYGLFGVTLMCAGTVWRVRLKFASVEDPTQRISFERKLVCGVAFVYIGLAASISLGYFFGVRMLR
jgi:hypothetical protein